ncbi:MAG: hypothetical protein QUS33_00750 [Dehalococcoidia bacterium]|nr:hypothetical protein [Dehalococcoidia bacterium]
MERNRRELDALAIFGIAVAIVAVILGPGMGCYAVVMGWPW